MNVEKEVYDMLSIVKKEDDVVAVELTQNDKHISVNDLIDFSDIMRQQGYEPRFDFHTILPENKREIMVHLKTIE